MRFQRIPCPIPGITAWGAATDKHTFVISQDTKEPGLYRASAKVVGARPFDGGRIDLGPAHNSMEEAEKACEKFVETGAN